MASAKKRLGAERAVFSGGYTARDVAKLLGLPVGQVHAYVRAGFLSPKRGSRNEYRFSFQDLVLLRTAKELTAQVPSRKVKRALGKLRDQLPRGRGLSGVRITAVGDTVVVRDGRSAWVPESGQALLNFEVAELASEAAPLVRKAADEARNVEEHLDADDWYDLACDLEACDESQARDAYRRVLELDPEHFDARLNLGRLLHEEGEIKAAELNYRMALRIRPDDATAAFNLGVALEDLGRKPDALRAYLHAIASDRTYADAHYNLARLYEQQGRRSNALQHFQTYRSLTQDPESGRLGPAGAP